MTGLQLPLLAPNPRADVRSFSLVTVESSCLQCADQGQSSSVERGYTNSTLIGFSPFTDEQGLYAHDPNGKVTWYLCSEGHMWSEGGRDPCPVDSCPYEEPWRVIAVDHPLPPGQCWGPRGPWEYTRVDPS